MHQSCSRLAGAPLLRSPVPVAVAVAIGPAPPPRCLLGQKGAGEARRPALQTGKNSGRRIHGQARRGPLAIVAPSLPGRFGPTGSVSAGPAGGPQGRQTWAIVPSGC